ncbi:DUF1761 domain-containing protein [Candidatus Roizmanbacteria bacterium]|nr:DUF1761 domain-containing protein [Candidatus Roizmanbacteria bacterium]
MLALNWVAVIVCVVVFMILGMIWYSPQFFGRQWASLSGKKMSDMQKGSIGMMYGLTFLLGLVMAGMLANVIRYAQVTSPLGGVKTGLWMWIGFIAPTMGINAIYQGKPKQLFLIDSGYFLVALVLWGIILTVWK